MKSNLEQVSAWIRSRQSIYPASYTGEVIEDEVINTLLENANAAPSHKHTEPWRFHVIGNSKLKDFGTFCQKQYAREFTGDRYSQRKYDKIAKKLTVTSHLIVIGMQRDFNESVPEWEEIAAVASAAQNICLSLPAAGIGGYWSSPAYLLNTVNEFLEMNAGERCLGFLYLGVLNSELPPAITKKPISDKTKWYN